VVHFLAPDETPLKQYQNTIKQMGYPGNPAASDVWELLHRQELFKQWRWKAADATSKEELEAV